jgi:hypothetical protein
MGIEVPNDRRVGQENKDRLASIIRHLSEIGIKDFWVDTRWADDCSSVEFSFKITMQTERV